MINNVDGLFIIQTYKIQELIDTSVDDKFNELNKKLIVYNTIVDK